MKNFKKRAPLLGILALIVVSLIGGTFAYFTQTSTAENYLTALNYDSTITEEFTPPADGAFAPGVEIDKMVGVTNTGDIPMLVRITYDEFWSNLTYAVVTSAVETGETSGVEDYGDAVAGVYDGINDADSKVLKNGTDADLWVYGGDGYYYYLAELAPLAATSPFISSIMLKEETSTTSTSYTLEWWDASIATPAFVTEVFTTESAALARKAEIDDLTNGSYAKSIISKQTTTAPKGDYILTFTTETVQAIKEGAATWNTSVVTVPAVTTFLTNVK